jgi:hypothetical protein
MMYGSCRECEHLGDCYPENAYIEEQMNANIKRDLCMNNDKVEWKQVDKRN